MAPHYESQKMIASFPALIYRSPGQQRKPGGGTYNFNSVQTKEELDAKLAAGWSVSSIEAIKAAGEKANGNVKPKPKWAIKLAKKKKEARPLDWREQVKTELASALEPKPIEDDLEPTREELETKATELGIRFDGRTKDKKLGQLIQDILSETGE